MRLLTILLIPIFIYSQDSNTVDCSKVFQDRKDELLRELDKIDEQMQAFEALKSATETILSKKEKKLKEKELELNATMKKITKDKEEIKVMLQKNKELLKAIKNAKDDKISLTYEKMKESAAASILENLTDSEAAKVLFNLKPKKISKIMAKMDPKKASSITLLLVKGPPFDKNSSK